MLDGGCVGVPFLVAGVGAAAVEIVPVRLVIIFAVPVAIVVMVGLPVAGGSVVVYEGKMPQEATMNNGESAGFLQSFL